MASKEFENLMRAMTFSLVNHGDSLEDYEKMVLIEAIARGSLDGEEAELIEYFNEHINTVEDLFDLYRKSNSDLSFTDFCNSIDSTITSHKFWNIFGDFVKKFKRLPFVVEFVGFFVASELMCPYLREYFKLPYSSINGNEDTVEAIKRECAEEVRKAKHDLAVVHDRYGKERSSYINYAKKTEERNNHLRGEISSLNAECKKYKMRFKTYTQMIGIPKRSPGRTLNERSLAKDYGSDSIESLWNFAHIACNISGDKYKFVYIDAFYENYVQFCKTTGSNFLLKGERFNKLILDMFKRYNINIYHNSDGISEILGMQFK